MFCLTQNSKNRVVALYQPANSLHEAVKQDQSRSEIHSLFMEIENKPVQINSIMASTAWISRYTSIQGTKLAMNRKTFSVVKHH